VDYDLPNEQAYCETCASVGMVFWNQRMFQLTGDGRYVDVLERSLYNGALAGLALSGDRFFYGNPLASSGQHERREWFGTACCPSNVARLVASVGNYVYASDRNNIWVNLFVGSAAEVPLGRERVRLEMQTAYPWKGQVELIVTPSRPGRFALRLRRPGWAAGEPVPGGLYRYLSAPTERFAVLVNGEVVQPRLEAGYYVIERQWKPGDRLEYRLPMRAQRLVSRDEVAANRQRVALQRGPLVYCFEGADNAGSALNFFLPDDARLEERWNQELLGGITTLTAEVPVLRPTTDGAGVEVLRRPVQAIPYYAWANRGPGQMQVWAPRRIGEVRVLAE
jgi:DUF1680 family protein